jgi:hypothetical protein
MAIIVNFFIPEILKKRGILFAVLAHIVGWVKRDIGTIYVGFAYLNAPQEFEIMTKLANPTRLGAVRRLNPTYDLSFRPTKWIAPFKEFFWGKAKMLYPFSQALK